MGWIEEVGDGSKKSHGTFMSDTLSRRELISLLLGAPAVAAMGCSEFSSVPTFEGELLGQSIAIGHRLRDGIQLAPDADAWEKKTVVIVGGGVAGLSAAWKLLRGGCSDFVVLELEPAPGGTSRQGQSTLTSFPWGAHYLPVPMPSNRPLIDLLLEMKVAESIDEGGHPVIAEQFLCREPEERLFWNGRWIEGIYPATEATPEDLEELAAFRKEMDRWVAWRDSLGRRAFAIPSQQASDEPEVLALDELTMTQWLEAKGWKSRRLHWLIDYSCRDDYGLSANQTSAWAGILYFAARIEKPGIDHQPIMTWPAGNGFLVKWFCDQIGDKLRLDAPVVRIDSSDAPQGPVRVSWLNQSTGKVHGIETQRLIFAAPQFLAPRVIAGFSDRFGRSVDNFRYGSWLTANIHLKERPKESGFPLAWDNVRADSASLGYVVATHQTGIDHGPTVWTWYLPYCAPDLRQTREKLMRASWADLVEVVLADLEQAHPTIRALVTRLDIFRWGHAMIQARPGFRTCQQRQQAALPLGSIHFANTDLSGIPLFEEAFAHGCRAADEVLVALNRLQETPK